MADFSRQKYLTKLTLGINFREMLEPPCAFCLRSFRTPGRDPLFPHGYSAFSP